MVRNDNHSTTQMHVMAECDVASDGQMVEFKDMRRTSESGKEQTDLS
jgi:hypothetical protein